jgi:hypothetical protein
MKITFSHNYPKLHGQTGAILLDVLVTHRSSMCNDFIEYDTSFINKNGTKDYYPLPKNKYLILVFFGNLFIPFTTVRRWMPEKEKWYRNGIGKVFDIEYTKQDAKL